MSEHNAIFFLVLLSWGAAFVLHFRFYLFW